MANQTKSNNPFRPKNLFPQEAPWRAYLYYIAIAVQLLASAVAGVGFSLNSGVGWLGGSTILILWFVILFIIVLDVNKPYSPKTHWVRTTAINAFSIILLCGVVELFMFGFIAPKIIAGGSKGDFVQLLIQMEHNYQYNDGTALCQQAAENLLKGENPYQHANIITAGEEFNISYDRITPLRVGQFANVFPYPGNLQLQELWNNAVKNPSQPPPELESQVCYPAGSFLLPAPFIAAGIKDIRIVYLLFVLAGLAYTAWKIPKQYRFVFIAGALISLELWNSILDGETGAIIFPLMVVAWFTLQDKFWVSTIFMGLAVATKQTAWFFLPFYLVLFVHYWGKRKLVTGVITIALVFFALNGYFMAAHFSSWMQSVLSPMLEPMFPIGIGAVTLTTSGLLNIHSTLPFVIMETISGIACFGWYLKYHGKYPHAGIILGVVPLFFAWRSLWSYFFYIGLILLAALLMKKEPDIRQPEIINQAE